MNVMRKTKLCIAICAAVAATSYSNLVTAVELEFHGDMNNRFQGYTNQRDWFNGSGLAGKEGALKKSSPTETYGEIKYRFWFEAATDDNAVRGVFATEIGGIRYGEGSGGDFSGDGTNVRRLCAALVA